MGFSDVIDVLLSAPGGSLLGSGEVQVRAARLTQVLQEALTQTLQPAPPSP
ncbi:MAG: hypothetical protein H0U51_00520 [Propionibacteriales bacterium]|nr:hypothetical protein [Propionibacteriales bacterium]